MTSALYLHVPFCARKCAYCDFSSWATPAGDPLMAAYVRALEAQMGEAEALGLLEGCETAYVGGGTPTLLGEKNLGSLVSAVRRAAPRLSVLTCEANPDSLSDDVLLAVRSAGATRLSIGVQSLNDAELLELGRLHLLVHRLHDRALFPFRVTERVIACVPRRSCSHSSHQYTRAAARCTRIHNRATSCNNWDGPHVARPRRARGRAS